MKFKKDAVVRKEAFGAPHPHVGVSEPHRHWGTGSEEQINTNHGVNTPKPDTVQPAPQGGHHTSATHHTTSTHHNTATAHHGNHSSGHHGGNHSNHHGSHPHAGHHGTHHSSHHSGGHRKK